MKPILIFAFLLFALKIQAQGHIDINVHYGMPIGSFKAGNIEDFSTKGNLNSGKYGFAGNGVGLGLKILFPIKSNGFHFILGADAYVNGLSKFIKDQYNNENIDTFQNRKVKFSNYFNIPISGGIFYQKRINDRLAIFGQLAPTLNFVKISSSSYSEKIDLVNESSELVYGWSKAIGCEIRAGIELNEKITLSLAYVNLGSQNISVSQKELRNEEETLTQSKMATKFAMVNATLGFRF